MLLVAILYGLIVSGIYAFIGGWAFMLSVGVIRAEWIHQLPTIGYWWAVVIVTLLRWTFNAIDTKSED